MDKLKKARNDKGWTMAYVAGQLGISESFYCQLENRTRGMSLKMAFKIAKVFGMMVVDLFSEDDFEVLSPTGTDN